MLRDGFLRFCDDPELACCRGEVELGRLRNENAQLHSQLLDAQRRADAAVECIEKIDDWNNHFCYHDLEEILDEWRGVKEENKCAQS